MNTNFFTENNRVREDSLNKIKQKKKNSDAIYFFMMLLIILLIIGMLFRR